jgi:hypothetical protein
VATLVSRRACAAAAALPFILVCAASGGARADTALGWHPNVVSTWASSVVSATRGPIDIANPGGPLASWGNNASALSPPHSDNFDVFALGDGGQITVAFAQPFGDGPGDDFAVFENGFFAPGGMFTELAFVEVSSNGVDFARFPAASLRATPVPSQEAVDPAQYHQLAGNHPLDRGTGFDLADLAGDPLVVAGDVDLDAITQVRLVDVIGNGSTVDASGRPVYDPYPTAYASGGFDLDAVGAPEPARPAMLAAGALCLWALARRRCACARAR